MCKRDESGESVRSKYYDGIWSKGAEFGESEGSSQVTYGYYILSMSSER